MRIRNKNITATKILYLFFLLLYLFAMLFPMFYLVSASFMSESDLRQIPAKLLPSQFHFDNYEAALHRQPLMKYVFNSFVSTIISVVICLTVGTLASYALVRTNIKGKKVFLLFILAISLLPTITIINPIYKLYSKLGLLNTQFGLALISSVMDLPMTIWFLTAMFKTVPVSIEESAELDGANMLQVFVKILLPLIKGGLFSIGVIDFIGAWNRYLLSQVLNPFESARTVVVGLTLYQLEITIPFEIVSAAAVMTIVPLFVMIMLFQKNILGGLLEGGIKE